MEKFKGTKGEWKATCFVLTTHGKTKVFSQTENDLEFWKYICDTYGNSNSYLPECEANAKLIAAAPDLLKALQKLVDNGFDIPSNKDIENARKAIDKALY